MNAFCELPTTFLVEHLSNEQYHARPEFSSSQLKDLLRSPAHFYSHHIAKEHAKESKKHLDFGTLAHTLFLEPEQFNTEFIVLPTDAPKPPTDVMRNAKNPSADSISRIEWWEAFNNTNAHKIIITEDQLAGAQRIVENLKSLSMYAVMQNDYGFAEASIFFTDPLYDLKLRVRLDWHIAPCTRFPNGLILDVKTSKDARACSFSKDCSKYGYDLSAVMYQEGFQKYYNTKDKPDFIYLVAENDAPFLAKQYKASDTFLACGVHRYNKAKELLAESLLIDEWDGYSTSLEEINLPTYFVKQILN